MTNSWPGAALAALIAIPALAQQPGAPPPDARPAEAPQETATRGTTGICGVVQDEKSGETLIEAPVAVVKGGTGETRTDVDGGFTLELAPGLYDVRARYELYQARRVNGLVVVAGECTRVTIKLGQQAEAGVDEVIVTARRDTRREATVLAERKVAAVVQDSISAQEISRTPDGVASDAVKRVVSATVIDDRVFLRGLGGRYSTVLLNGVPLPSPDADEHAVPLDLFPTSLLSSLNVVKTYSAHLPGSFAGGALLVETTGYPSKAETRLELSTGVLSSTTGKTRRTYDGGGLDWLGYDDGTRSLPGLVPNDRAMISGNLTPEEQMAATRAFRNQWSATEKTALPAYGLGLSRGDTVNLSGRKLGYLVSLDYGAKETATKVYSTTEPNPATATTPFILQEGYETEKGQLSVDLSGLAQLGLELDADHDLSLLALYTHSGVSTAQRSLGTNYTSGLLYDADRLQFVERGMFFGQLRGEHRLRGLGEIDVDWQANLAYVTRDEPDTRDVLYTKENDFSPFSWASNLVGSSDRFFSEVRDTSGGAGLNVKKLFESTLRLQAGLSAQVNDRSFDGRRFEFFENPADPTQRAEEPEVLFGPANVIPNFLIREITEMKDGYRARQSVYAGYAVVDLPVLPGVRIIPGARYEAARVEMTPGTSFAIVPGTESGVDRDDSAFLPAVNGVWAFAPGQNLRAAWSHTIVRPQFRELAPFVYRDFDRKRTVEGNPDLASTRIQNADLRWEWFPGDEEVLAASAFYKRFADPIELVTTSSTGQQAKYQNAAAATAYGLEVEGRVSLGRFLPALSGLRAAANVAVVLSEVELGDDSEGISTDTSTTRPLQGQSPYVVNGSLTWERNGLEITGLYNVYGRRLNTVGYAGVPDAYEQPFHRLDLTLSQRWHELRFKLSLTNLLDSRMEVEQGGLRAYSEESGIAGSFSFTWSR